MKVKIFGKRTAKGLEALQIKYPSLMLFSLHKKIFIVVGIIYSIALIKSVGFFLESPQEIFSNLVATILEVSLLILATTSILFLKIFTGAEGHRIDNKERDIEASYVFPFVATIDQIYMNFNRAEYYKQPEYLEVFWRFSRINREDFFLTEAGALDIPKLSLRKIILNNRTVHFELGHASFFDIFFTHYSPDLVVSKVENSDTGQDKTLRTLLGTELSVYYTTQFREAKSMDVGGNREIEFAPYLPNPLGMSGIVLLRMNGTSYVVLRRREPGEIAARNCIEWSFAGTFESTSWLAVSEVPLNDLVRTEYEDEVSQYSQTLHGCKFKPKLIGWLVNKLYLFQPEIFVVCDIKVEQHQLDKIKSEFHTNTGGRVWVECIESLPKLFASPDKVKNLCPPGYLLLKQYLTEQRSFNEEI